MAAEQQDESQFIVKGPPLRWDPPKVNISKFLLECMKKHGSKILQVDPYTKEEYSFEKFRQLSIRTALEMRARGVEKGDFVSICANNHMNAALPFMGTLYLAAVVSPIHTIFTQMEATRILSRSNPKMIFCDAKQESLIKDILKDIGTLEKTQVIVFERDFQPFLEPHVGEDDFEVVDVDDVEKDIAVLVCTSGSSGSVKAVPLTHRSYFVSISTIVHSRLASGNQIGTLLFYSPLSWSSGFKLLAQCMIVGCKRICAPYNPDKHLQIMVDYNVTAYFSAAGYIVEMIRHPDFPKYHKEIASNLKALIYGGAPVTLAQIRLFRETLPTTLCMNGYGSTEMGSSHGHFDVPDPNNEKKEFSVGKLFFEFESKTIDTETGKALGRSQPGELCFKSPFMMTGYYKDPEQTAQVIDKDGWYHTGDLGYIDEDGYLFIIDRIKEVFKCKMVHINPTEVEAVLLEHPAVQCCSVVGKPHEIDVAHPAAFIVKREGFNVTEQEIIDFTESKLTDAQTLRGGVRFIDKLPMTGTGKVRRVELRKMLEAEE